MICDMKIIHDTHHYSVMLFIVLSVQIDIHQEVDSAKEEDYS